MIFLRDAYTFYCALKHGYFAFAFALDGVLALALGLAVTVVFTLALSLVFSPALSFAKWRGNSNTPITLATRKVCRHTGQTALVCRVVVALRPCRSPRTGRRLPSHKVFMGHTRTQDYSLQEIR